jgi:hypothetical protein
MERALIYQNQLNEFILNLIINMLYIIYNNIIK